MAGGEVTPAFYSEDEEDDFDVSMDDANIESLSALVDSLRIDLRVIFATRDSLHLLRNATRTAIMQVISAALATQDLILSNLYGSKLEWMAPDRAMTKVDISNYFSAVLQLDADREALGVRMH